MRVPYTEKKLTLNIDLKFSVFFFALFLLFSQLHEFSHILTGRIICGCYGAQLDFNVWTLCSNCFEANALGPLATLAGPVFSFSLIWIGVWMLYSKNNSIVLQGLLLIFINKPFARIFTAIAGGGDELKAMQKLFGALYTPATIKIFTIAVLLLLTILPLYLCYKKLANKRRLLIVTGLCIIPMIVQYIYSFKILNLILKAGFLNNVHFMGIADMVLIHTGLIAILCAILYRKIIPSRAYILK